jgi:hypothetical protein
LQIKTNKMEYYNIDVDYTPSITGKRDGDVAKGNSKIIQKRLSLIIIFYGLYNKIKTK